MTTHADDSQRADDAAVSETPDAPQAPKARRAAKEAREARAVKADKPKAAPVTQELPATAQEPSMDGMDGMDGMEALDTGVELDDEEDAGATREAPIVAAPPATDDPAATLLRAPQPLRPDAYDAADAADVSALDEPMTEPAPSRPRYNTLAGAFNRSRPLGSNPNVPDMHEAPDAPDAPVTPPSLATPTGRLAPLSDALPATDVNLDGIEGLDDILDEVGEDEDEDEWAVADQATVQWTPSQIAQMQRMRPDFLQTGEQASWPPRPDATPPIAPESDASHHDWRAGLPPRPRPPFPLDGAPRPRTASEPRLAAPDGRMAPEPASASTAGAQPDPRMERFQELRSQRVRQGEDERVAAGAPPVANTVRQWWNDLRPNVGAALRFQHEARASGMHPIPAYEPTGASRLGDAFGRLAASARELSERAQQAVEPTIKRVYDQVEQAAQGLVSRFEGDTVRQQAPLLGPGRIAIFFRQGVSVGQAQRLLATSSARPMRLIPRKHGFLARVQPGKEAEVCERLRIHPYVRDVIYLEYNEYGEPVSGRR